MRVFGLGLKTFERKEESLKQQDFSGTNYEKGF